jgi:hypothetical protein
MQWRGETKAKKILTILLQYDEIVQGKVAADVIHV